MSHWVYCQNFKRNYFPKGVYETSNFEKQNALHWSWTCFTFTVTCRNCVWAQGLWGFPWDAGSILPSLRRKTDASYATEHLTDFPGDVRGFQSLLCLGNRPFCIRFNNIIMESCFHMLISIIKLPSQTDVWSESSDPISESDSCDVAMETWVPDPCWQTEELDRSCCILTVCSYCFLFIF